MAIQRRTAPAPPYLRLAERLLGVKDTRNGGLRGPLPSAAEIAAIADDL